MKHTVTTREEFRYGMREPEIRITCSCDWVEKVQNKNQARVVVGKHIRGVTNEMKEKGYSNTQIAEELDIPENLVRVQTSSDLENN